MAPSLRVERALLREVRSGAVLAAIDEVGRGALAGPVAVGVVIIDTESRSAPQGVRDSKDLDPATRERLAPRVRTWARHSAVGLATSDEIDSVGIIGALALAASRGVNATGAEPDIVLLDGKHDWLSRVAPRSRVVTRIKADSTCASVAAASIIAKVARDAHMVRLAALAPQYAWDSNKGYAAPEHVAALQAHGPSRWHRVTWQLPGVQPRS
ncbi:MAG: hypothetical protein RL347_783 [Actinomycetota bacterium]